jgi:hypothetical protein
MFKKKELVPARGDILNPWEEVAYKAQRRDEETLSWKMSSKQQRELFRR